MSNEVMPVFSQEPADAMVSWQPGEFAGVAISGSVASPARTTRMTLAALDALALSGALVERTIVEVTDAGFLAVAASGSSYRRYYPIHIGTEPPEDTSTIWFQPTS